MLASILLAGGLSWSQDYTVDPGSERHQDCVYKKSENKVDERPRPVVTCDCLQDSHDRPQAIHAVSFTAGNLLTQLTAVLL